MVGLHTISLEWKEDLNLDLNAVEAWMRANAGEAYCGNQAHVRLDLYFSEEPSEEVREAVQEYWDGLDEDSEEAASYMSAEAVQAAVAAKKASGKAKLLALGLTEEEVAALVG